VGASLMDKRQQKDFVNALTFALLVGAAMTDATAQQRDRLRAELKPLMPRIAEDGDLKPCARKLVEVMGQEWLPTGDFGRYIKALSCQR
jgi:hypothetical protein